MTNSGETLIVVDSEVTSDSIHFVCTGYRKKKLQSISATDNINLDLRETGHRQYSSDFFVYRDTAEGFFTFSTWSTACICMASTRKQSIQRYKPAALYLRIVVHTWYVYPGYHGGKSIVLLPRTVTGGDSIERAMEGALAAMFNTITDIAKIDPDPSLTRLMEIEGVRISSMLL